MQIASQMSVHVFPELTRGAYVLPRAVTGEAADGRNSSLKSLDDIVKSDVCRGFTELIAASDTPYDLEDFQGSEGSDYLLEISR